MEPNVPGANGILPIPPQVARPTTNVWLGFISGYVYFEAVSVKGMFRLEPVI